MTWFYDPTVAASQGGAGAINATFAVTISAVTQSASATLPISATFNQTIDAVVLTSTATVESAVVASTGGGWLSEEQIKAHDEQRKKRKTRQRELEETIELAYKRLTGKISAKAILEPTKDEPEKLAKLGSQLAAQLVTKGTDSARMRTRNAQIIADLKRLANEVIEHQAALQIEEEAIVMLLLA